MLQRCKILGRTISFTLRYIEIRKHFLKYHSPLCASKSFCMYMCYHILHIVWKWLAGTRGGGGGNMFSSPKTPGLLTFFKIKVLKINHPGPPLECQTVWIQIKTDILLVFIWVQTVCKRLLADDKIIHWRAKSYNR